MSVSRWSVVIPYFNEAGYLPATLASLIAQDFRPFQLILVDNASHDGTTECVTPLLTDVPGVSVVYLNEERPGKINALECALARVDTEFVAFCDADTFYPRHYLRRCDELFANSPDDVVAVMGTRLSGPPDAGWRRVRQAKIMLWSHIFSKQCLTGGFGQNFRTAALVAVGGYSTAQWPYVFEDHEIMQRLFKIGRSRYAFDLWCVPSMRRTERGSVDWTLLEKRLYGILPFAFKDWYFYTFLARRFAARQMYQINLRRKVLEPPQGATGAEASSVTETDSVR